MKAKVCIPKKNKIEQVMAIDFDDNGRVITCHTKTGKYYFGFDEETDPKLLRATGINDMNGKEIYEKDIIKVDGLLYEVFWDLANACWAAETDSKYLANELNIDGVFQLNADEEQFYEIIGNFYKNSKLLNNN